MTAALALAAPEGIDFFFDNTGGHVTTAAWSLLKDGARVAVCGGTSHYYAGRWNGAESWTQNLPPGESDLRVSWPMAQDGAMGRTGRGSDPVVIVSTTQSPFKPWIGGRHITVQALDWRRLDQTHPYDAEFNARVPGPISEGLLLVNEWIFEGIE